MNTGLVSLLLLFWDNYSHDNVNPDTRCSGQYGSYSYNAENRGIYVEVLTQPATYTPYHPVSATAIKLLCHKHAPEKALDLSAKKSKSN